MTKTLYSYGPAIGPDGLYLMSKTESFSPARLVHGVYRIYWNDGGTSVAAVGTDEKGRKWFCPANWVGAVPYFDWKDVDRVELIEPAYYGNPETQGTGSPAPADAETPAEIGATIEPYPPQNMTSRLGWFIKMVDAYSDSPSIKKIMFNLEFLGQVVSEIKPLLEAIPVGVPMSPDPSKVTETEAVSEESSGCCCPEPVNSPWVFQMSVPLDSQGEFDLMIGRLNRILSEMIDASKKRPLDRPNYQTLKHHAEDMIGAGQKILAKLKPLQVTMNKTT